MTEGQCPVLPLEVLKRIRHHDGLSPAPYQAAAEWGWGQAMAWRAGGPDALQAAADGELEECCEWLAGAVNPCVVSALRARAAMDAAPVPVGGPSDQEILDLADDSDMDRLNGERGYPDGTVVKEVCWEAWEHQLVAFVRAVLARYGTAPPPASDGEVGELVCWPNIYGQRIRAQITVLEPCPVYEWRSVARRAAALLERQQPRPVPVAERPWEREGWCDAEGRCWFGAPTRKGGKACWTLDHTAFADDTHCLPATALPLPEATL